VKIERAEAVCIRMPLKFAFETSYGRETEREAVLVRLDSEGLSGWGEAAVSNYPDYSYETPDVSMVILEKYLLPLVAGMEFDDPAGLCAAIGKVKGYPFTRTAVETAFIDLYCRSLGEPVHRWIGGERTHVPSGISLGIEDDQGVLFDRIRWALEQGYQRIKLKIKPGRDVSVVAAVRENFDYFPLMVDANAAYTLEDIDSLKDLDSYHLIMIEQPLAADDLARHAELQKRIRTHVCLDESIRGLADLRAAVALGSCRVVNVKYGRVGGLMAARGLARECVQEGIAVWCGGMLETGIGRAHNLALNSMSEFSLPGDISASDRYYEQDVIEPPVTMEDGVIELSNEPGMGYRVREDLIKKFTRVSISR